MKKIIVLSFILVLAVFLLSACSLDKLGSQDVQVTPALTPLLTVDAGTAPSPSPAAPATATVTNIIAGAGPETAQRTPIAIAIPLTRAVPTATPAAATPIPTATPAAQATTPPQPTAAPTPVEKPTPEAYQGVPVTLDETLNILVVGSDERRPGQPWRSDVIMLVAVDFGNHQVGVISFPRDLYVDIPTVGKNRINTATFFGGVNNYPDGGDMGLLKATLAQNFGIRVDHAVKFNFDTFRDMIDALGGIDIEVVCPITGKFPVEPGSKQLKWQTLPAGQYHMDGEFALRYVRERKTTSDVDRNRRQQRVLIAMRKRAREINIIPRIPALYDAMRDNIETDLGLTDIIALTRLGLQIDTKDVHGFNIGYKEADSWTSPAGAAVLKPDMDKIAEGMRTLFSKPSILKNPARPRTCK
jgi:LCP family protein required for cell wall assembly